MQALLARLLAEPRLLDAVAADPESYAKRYRLTTAEVTSLIGAASPGLIFSVELTRWKNFRDVDGALPGTLALCRAVVADDEIFTQCLAGTRTFSLQGVVDTADRLGALAVRHAAAADVPVIEDMVRFESALQRVGRRPRAPAEVSAQGPALDPRGEVLAFGCAVNRIRRRLTAGTAYEELRGQRTYCLVVPGKAGKGRTLVLRVSAGMYELLRMCDGSMPTDALAKRLGVSAGSVANALAYVQSKGVELTA